MPRPQDKESAPEALVRLSAAGSKNLRAELSVASAELRDKAGELSQVQLALRYAHPACTRCLLSCSEAYCVRSMLLSWTAWALAACMCIFNTETPSFALIWLAVRSACLCLLTLFTCKPRST